MGVLYVVPTPIGNLEDITLRALRVLREVSLIAAEDTRRTRVLLQHYDIDKAMLSYHDHNEERRVAELLEALTRGDVALVSDAGMPTLADPGHELLRAALAEGLRVEVLPGPDALTTALVGSGLPSDSFIWLGFLPVKAGRVRSCWGACVTSGAPCWPARTRNGCWRRWPPFATRWASGRWSWRAN